MKDIMSGTPKVLKEYFELISSPSHETYIDQDEGAMVNKFFNHPDIQYFKKIKAKNHYNYHKLKNNNKPKLDISMVQSPIFDPYNRNDLLKRLSTYTALNWHIPFSSDQNEIDELECARNGWKCVSISANNNTKNHLLCTSCNHQLILKFNDINSPSTFVPFDFDLEDYQELNESLISGYSKQIRKFGHSSDCPWINFETPLDGVYYPRPFISSTNELLTNEYLKNLKNLASNLDLLNSTSSLFKETLFNEDENPNFTDFIKISKNWLLDRYFKDNKENFFNLLERVPRWIYKIAVLGWDLHIQSFSNHLVLLLICSKCNKRIFLNSVYHEPIEKNNYIAATNFGVNLSSSGVLTPCKFPPVIQGGYEHHDTLYTESGPDESEFDDLDKDKIDLVEEHKPWCCNINLIDESTSLYQYYINIVTSSGSVHNEGKFHTDYDIDINHILNSAQKRKNSFDIDEGLERFQKLRKLYLVDEDT